MSEQSEFEEKMWTVLNLHADTLLKLSRHKTAVWKAMIAGAALMGAGAALQKMFG